jgi:MFS family permease
MSKRALGALVFLVGIGLIWLGAQTVGQEHGADPRNKVMVANWLETELWVNPWLIGIGLVGLMVAVLLLAKMTGPSIARLAVLLIGVAGLAWAAILPVFECTYPSPDYGVCSDNSALKWELAIVGAILVGVATVSYLVARRRHASQPA